MPEENPDPQCVARPSPLAFPVRHAAPILDLQGSQVPALGRLRELHCVEAAVRWADLPLFIPIDPGRRLCCNANEPTDVA